MRDKGKPLLISASEGQGTLIWSGMNLMYHIQHNTNVEESKVYIKLLELLVPLTNHPYTSGQRETVSSRVTRFVSDTSGRGILFKEQFFSGWQVEVNGRNLRAYQAGPAFPGFIYVPFLKSSGPIKARFAFDGHNLETRDWIISRVVLVILLDLILFQGNFVGKRILRLSKYGYTRIRRWWEKEEDKE